jgi:hypothetical protein
MNLRTAAFALAATLAAALPAPRLQAAAPERMYGMDNAQLNQALACNAIADAEAVLALLAPRGTYEQQLPVARKKLPRMPEAMLVARLKAIYAQPPADALTHAGGVFGACASAQGLPLDRERVASCYGQGSFTAVMAGMLKDAGVTRADFIENFPSRALTAEQRAEVQRRFGAVWDRDPANRQKDQAEDLVRVLRCAQSGNAAAAAGPAASIDGTQAQALAGCAGDVGLDIGLYEVYRAGTPLPEALRLAHQAADKQWTAPVVEARVRRLYDARPSSGEASSRTGFDACVARNALPADPGGACFAMTIYLGYAVDIARGGGLSRDAFIAGLVAPGMAPERRDAVLAQARRMWDRDPADVAGNRAENLRLYLECAASP